MTTASDGAPQPAAQDPLPLPQLGVAESAAALAPLLVQSDLIVGAVDEPRAKSLAQSLQAMAPQARVLFCPGSDALPGDAAPASPANVGMRVSALRAARLLSQDQAGPRIVLVTTGEALARAYPGPEAFDAEPPRIAVGEAVRLPQLYETLQSLGYVADDRVDEPGEVGLRGQVLDVYPADTRLPLRIEASDDRITSIRTFNPVDQRSTGDVESHELGRVCEPPLGEHPGSLLAHLPGARVIIGAAADERRRRFLKLAADATRRGGKRALTGIIDEATWTRALAQRDQLSLAQEGEPPPRFVEERAPMRLLTKVVQAAIGRGDRILLLGSDRDLRFVAPRVSRTLRMPVERVTSWSEVDAAKAGRLLSLAVAAERGFRRVGVLAIAAADLIGSRAEREYDVGVPVSSFDHVADIRIGDVVIHEDHGIGIVAGLEPLPSSEADGDAIKLSYANEATRLVPVSDADRIWRYGAEQDAVTLDKLDGSSWQKRRGEIDAAIAESARQLTTLAAERAGLTAPVLEPPPAAYERFAGGFPFTETRDQQAAIDAVRQDLASGKPMDRLIVGDVGFGKTEVALRAAAIAALAGKQVALAAPTTVLARQHLESFSQRFEGTDVVVCGLSRLSTPAERKRVRSGLADGSIQVVIGTGSVAGKGISYHDLGLVIIDEEQRFGAADKSRLQALSAGHVLTMSATPIPRTLQSAMVGLRQLSVIATPPARRQPIRTAVSPFAPDTLRTALLRERSRGGQSFVVVPRISDMAPLQESLGRLVPELEILAAHGKMAAAEIDETMVRFGRGDGDVLLATNIIEAGLDVPRANTMAIMHADRFGLSQLHQLRGRVGRGGRRGQVLLFTDAESEIAPRTLKRLRTLEAFDRLGAGFAISARDLEMRGAGDLLGDTQAGHMRLIGVELYQRLLEGALRKARGEDVDRWTPVLHLGIEGALPEAWIPDADSRVSLYVRLARISEAAELDTLEMELEDRFGPLPVEAQRLLFIALLRLRMRAADIARVEAGPAAIAITPRGTGMSLEPLTGLEEKNGRWLLREAIDNPSERLQRLHDLLDQLT